MMPGEASRRHLNSTNTLNQAKLSTRHAVISGTSGALAGILQVVLLMWLRTTMNFQYAKGGDFFSTLSYLYRNGGIPRLYRGMSFALIQNPAARFGDTAANSGGLFLLNSFYPETGILQKIMITTFISSIWRMLLTPIELAKTIFQVHGKDGLKVLRERISISGLFSLWSGAFAIVIANWVGSYPWFVTFNVLQNFLKPAQTPNGKIVRNAFIGLSSSMVSDSCSNGIRVVKTVVQTNVDFGYLAAAQKIYREGGIRAILFRGLTTRMLSNALQSVLFTVVWKICEHQLLLL